MNKKIFIRFLACFLAIVLTIGMFGTVAAYAATKEEILQDKVNNAKNEFDKESAALKDAQNNKNNVQKEVTNLSKKTSEIVNNINSLNQQLSSLDADIAAHEQKIASTQEEIENKQIEIEDSHNRFKKHMAAMQEMHDGGAIAFLQNVKSLYELLTFNDVLQDIATKDKEMLDDLRSKKEELNAQKEELEKAKIVLEESKLQVSQKQAELESKKTDLAQSLKQANENLSAAQATVDAQKMATDEAQKIWDAARKEQEDYVKSVLDKENENNATMPVRGLSFQKSLPYYTYISTYFGAKDAWHSKAHGGTDFAAPKNTPIYAVESGTISIARPSSSYGNYVVVNHGRALDGNSYATLYAHMTSYAVRPGDAVNKGDVIGYVGSTGRSTGNHLHLELHINGRKTDPLKYIPY